MYSENLSFQFLNFNFNKFYFKIRKHNSKSNNIYDLIPFPREELSNYELILNKINGKLRNSNINTFLCLYLMKANLNPIRIYSKEDWEDYYNNGVIQKFIDDKNKSSELKLEYEFFKEKEKINYENHNIKK